MESIGNVIELVSQAGTMALDAQKSLNYQDRQYKKDGSVVTEIDRMVEDFLYEQIDRLYPGCNFITEERSHQFDPERPYTFVIDPIDGTDNFSQGMHFWSISVALLNSEMQPISGVVYAPKLDLLFAADINGPATLNSKPLNPPPIHEFTDLTGVIVSSRVHRELDMRNFPGKIRAFGSAAIHLSFPLAYPGMAGSIHDDRAFAWDIAGAHAICKAAGWSMQYMDGRGIDYGAMQGNDWRVADFFVSGTEKVCGLLTDCITRYV